MEEEEGAEEVRLTVGNCRPAPAAPSLTRYPLFTVCRPRPQIETSRGRALADEYGMKFFETSAKDGTNVAEAFNELARDAVVKLQLLAGQDGGRDAGGVKVVKGGKDGKDKDGKDCAIM